MQISNLLPVDPKTNPYGLSAHMIHLQVINQNPVTHHHLARPLLAVCVWLTSSKNLLWLHIVCGRGAWPFSFRGRG